MLQILEKIIPPIIYNYIIKIKNLKKTYYGFEGLDKKLESYLNFENGFFVELGANDGKTQSNTLYFETYRNWKGVLIEPTPSSFLKCLTNRNSKTQVFCNACVSFDYPDKYVEIIYSNLMSTPIGLESDIKDANAHTDKGVKFLPHKETKFKFGAIAKTLNSILDEANAPKDIDFLSLDVEGAELEVLKGIDFNKYVFKFICIESRSIESISQYMKKQNYNLIEKITHHDYLFKHVDQ